MKRYESQQGIALIMVIGVITVVLLFGASLAMLMVNDKGASYDVTARAKAFNVAEAGLDMGMYSLSSTWPSTPPSAGTPVPLCTPLASMFPATSFPASSGKVFDTVTMKAGVDSQHLTLIAQANIAGKSVALQTGIVQKNVGLTSLMPGFALYSGADTTLTGSQTITSPLSNGVPTGGIYVYGNLNLTGSQNFSTAGLKVFKTLTAVGSQQFSSVKTQNDSTVPTFSSVLPQSQITYLTNLAQATPSSPTGVTVVANGGTIPTSATAVHVTGSASITGSSSYTIGSLYVDGNLTITGSETLNISSLYVGGTLSVTGSENLTNLGPTWVGGNATVTGSGNCKLPLLVAGGSITMTGSATWGGDGVGSDPQPCVAIALGSGGVTWTGSGPFYGLLAATTGGISDTGSGNVYGSVLSAGAATLTGSSQLVYNANVVNAIHTGSSTIAVLVPGTWAQVPAS